MVAVEAQGLILRVATSQLSAKQLRTHILSLHPTAFYLVPHHLILQLRKPRLHSLLWKLDLLILKCTVLNASVSSGWAFNAIGNAKSRRTRTRSVSPPRFVYSSTADMIEKKDTVLPAWSLQSKEKHKVRVFAVTLGVALAMTGCFSYLWLLGTLLRPSWQSGQVDPARPTSYSVALKGLRPGALGLRLLEGQARGFARNSGAPPTKQLATVQQG